MLRAPLSVSAAHYSFCPEPTGVNPTRHNCARSSDWPRCIVTHLQTKTLHRRILGSRNDIIGHLHPGHKDINVPSRPEIFHHHQQGTPSSHKLISLLHTITCLQDNILLLYHNQNQDSLNHTTMFSCVNYERGCRGRCNASGARCDSCVTLNLQTVRTNSSSSVNERPQAAYSAMTSSFASLSQLTSQSQRAS